MCLREELGEVLEMPEGRYTREAKHLWDIWSLQRGGEAEMNVLSDELVGFDALILYLREKIKVIEGEINASEMELELLKLESKQSKSTTK